MQVMLTGVVSRMVHASPTGGAIFRLLPDGSARTIRIVANYKAMPAAPDIGEKWALAGQFKDDVRFGRQFYADSAVRQVPKGAEIVVLLSQHVSFAEISTGTAKRLWRKLGTDLYQSLETADITALCSTGIFPAFALRLVRAWRQYCLEVKVSTFFAQQGFSLGSVRKSIEYWGQDTVRRISENPYLLVPLSSWADIDSATRNNLSFAADASIRLIAACNVVLNEGLRRHSTALPIALLRARLTAKLGKRELAERAITLATDERQLIWIHDKGQLYAQAQGIHIIEQAIRRRIEAMTQRNSLDGYIQYNSHADSRRPRASIKMPENLGSKLSLLVNHCISVVLAWPVEGALLAKQLALPNAIHVFPSESLRETTESPNIGTTALLADVLSGSPLFPTDTSCLIVVHDAASLDIIASNKLLHFLPPNAKLCLLGSPESAYPPGPGLFFHLLADSPNIQARMTAAELGIPEASPVPHIHRLEANSSKSDPSVPKQAPQYVRFLEESKSVGLISTALQVYREAAEQGRAAIIAETWRTAQILNIQLHNELVELRQWNRLPALHVSLHSKVEATIGDVVTYRGRNYCRGLMLGSRGPITEIFDSPVSEVMRDGTLVTSVARANIDTVGMISLTADDCAQFSLGYAVPPEFARWSVWAQVVICLDGRKVLDQRWMHTLLSRTSYLMTIIGTQEHLEIALQDNLSRRRSIGLAL